MAPIGASCGQGACFLIVKKQSPFRPSLGEKEFVKDRLSIALRAQANRKATSLLEVKLSNAE